ncbi:hypothetical protein [Streptomyces sp. NPDC050704]
MRRRRTASPGRDVTHAPCRFASPRAGEADTEVNSASRIRERRALS